MNYQEQTVSHLAGAERVVTLEELEHETGLRLDPRNPQVKAAIEAAFDQAVGKVPNLTNLNAEQVKQGAIDALYRFYGSVDGMLRSGEGSANPNGRPLPAANVSGHERQEQILELGTRFLPEGDRWLEEWKGELSCLSDTERRELMRELRGSLPRMAFTLYGRRLRRAR